MMVEFCEAILSRNPRHVDTLKRVGHLYTELGAYEDGLRIDLVLTELLPDDNIARYNLACSYALQQITDKAVAALEKAVELGYNDIDHLRADSDLDSIRDCQPYKTLMLKLLSEKVD